MDENEDLVAGLTAGILAAYGDVKVEIDKVIAAVFAKPEEI